MSRTLVVLSLVFLAALALPARADAPKFEIEHGQLKVASPIAFEPATAKLTADSDAALDYVKQFLDAKPDITTLRVEAHTDNSGDAKDSQALSEKRALAVAKALVSRGIDCKRLVPAGFGATKPIADNATPDGKAQNRRVAFVMAALRGKLIGGAPADGGGVAGNACAK